MSVQAPRERVRLFFALWPDDQVRSALADLARAAQSECGGRATPFEKIHMTLLFIGMVNRSRVCVFSDMARALTAKAFQLDVNVIGYFRHNRVVWVGTQRCPAQLSTLAGRLHACARAEQIEVEERPYVPHATLIRNAERAPRRRALAPITWDVHDFALVESVPVHAGVRYDVIGRWALANA